MSKRVTMVLSELAPKVLRAILARLSLLEAEIGYFERFLGELTSEVAREASFQSVRAIESYLAERNQNPRSTFGERPV